MTINNVVGTSGHVAMTATKIEIKMVKNVRMMLAVVAPNSNAASPRRHPWRHA